MHCDMHYIDIESTVAFVNFSTIRSLCPLFDAFHEQHEAPVSR